VSIVTPAIVGIVSSAKENLDETLANGISTGSNVRSFTSSATWGFQNNAVAYQLPSHVVGCDEDAATADLKRSSSFLVQCRVYMGSAEVSRSDCRVLLEKTDDLLVGEHAPSCPFLPRKRDSTDVDLDRPTGGRSGAQ
jgi:hypothetical protein